MSNAWSSLSELERKAWQPPEDVTLHNDQPIPAEMEFLFPPPSEIGKIITAHSTLTRQAEPYSLAMRLILILVLPLVLATVAYLLMPQKRNDNLPALAMGFVVGTVSLLIAWWITSFKHQLTFVGVDGIAEITLKSSREATPKTQSLVFRDAWDCVRVKHGITPMGFYTNTQYYFHWSNEQKQNIYVLSGSYRSEAGTPKAPDPYWYGLSGELAWSQHFFERSVNELEKTGSIEFRASTGILFGKELVVRIGSGFIEFDSKGDVTRLTPNDIKNLSLANGHFSIHTHNTRWFSSQGKFEFDYSTLSNARVFLLALERLVGYTFS